MPQILVGPIHDIEPKKKGVPVFYVSFSDYWIDSGNG